MLWLTLEEGKCRSTRSFTSTSPQNVKQSTDQQVPWSLKSQNKEGCLVQELNKSEHQDGQLHLSKSPSTITFSLSGGCRYDGSISSCFQYSVQKLMPQDDLSNHNLTLLIPVKSAWQTITS